MKETDCNRVYCEHYQETEHICCKRYCDIRSCNDRIPELQLDQLTRIADALEKLADPEIIARIKNPRVILHPGEGTNTFYGSHVSCNSDTPCVNATTERKYNLKCYYCKAKIESDLHIDVDGVVSHGSCKQTHNDKMRKETNKGAETDG